MGTSLRYQPSAPWRHEPATRRYKTSKGASNMAIFLLPAILITALFGSWSFNESRG